MLVEIWDRANGSKLADIDQLDVGIQRRVKDLEKTGVKLNEAGSGGFAVMSDHPAVNAFVGGRTVRMYDDDGAHVWSWTIKDVKTVHLADEERQVVTVEGPGLLERFSQGSVYPWNGNLGRPVSIDRVFNWASPPIVWSGSGGVYLQERVFPLAYLPEAWPIAAQFGYYINTRAFVPAGAHPVGDTLLRCRYETEEATNVAFYISGDDTFELWCDGVLLEREPNKQPDNSGNESTWRYVVHHTVGEHVVAIKLTNWDVSDVSSVNPSAVIFSAFPVNSAGIITEEPLFTSSADTFDWEGLDYPSTFPGFTFPQILQMLLDECQDRDELLGWTISVHGSHDQVPEFACKVGDTLLKVIEAGAASYVDVECDLEGLVLHVYPKGALGTATDVEIVEGVNLEYLSESVDDEFFNRVIGIWAEGTMVVEDAVSIAANEVRPTPLELGSVTDATAVEEILQAHLEANKEPLRSIVAQVVPSPGATAGTDFRPGDTVAQLGHIEDPKCVGVTWTLDDWGTLASPEFDHLSAVRAREKLRSVQFKIDRFDSPATAQILAPDLKIPSGRVQTQSQSWSWTGDIELARSYERDDPDAPWQPWKPSRQMRIYMFEVAIKYEDLADATGDSVFELHVNGALLDGLLNLTLDTTTHEARKWISPYQGVVTADTEISVACIETGNHVDGSVTVRLADVV